MKRSRVKPISDKRVLALLDRQEEILATFGHPNEWECAIKGTALVLGVGPCFGPVHAHEILKRSQGGSITDTDNMIMLCNFHNGWVEDHPARAHVLGLVRHSWEKSGESLTSGEGE